jgi:hypothetical protein
MEGYEMESMMVDGPISYSCWLYTNPEGRPTIIHNFGDLHRLTSGCSGKQEAKGFVSIEDLISETMSKFENPNLVVDFFFEAPRTDNYGLDYGVNGCYGFKTIDKPLLSQGAMNRLENKFRNCLSVGSEFLKKCSKDFPSGRIHAIDIRDALGINDNQYDYIVYMENKKSDNWQFFKILVKNQIFRVEDENVYNKLYELYKIIKAFSYKELYKQTYVSLMDIYLLGRLFRSYVPLLGQKQKTGFNNAPVQNAVIYSGNTHKKNYDIFFRKIGAVELYSFKSPKMYKLSNMSKMSKTDNNLDRHQCVQIPVFLFDGTESRTLPIVEEFWNDPDTIVNAYKQFNEKYRNLSKNRLHRHYSIDRKEARVQQQAYHWNGTFENLKIPKKKFPKRLRSEEPQAKRQRREGKEEEP